LNKDRLENDRLQNPKSGLASGSDAATPERKSF
jgi:hypothetical protein